MRAVWLILAAGFRRQWKSWVLLTVLIAVASGFVLASTAAGGRTDSAFPRYVASHRYDAIVYSVQPLPQLAQLPEVAQVTPVQMPFIGLPGCSCRRQITYGAFSVREVPPGRLGRVAKLVAGRMPDPSSPTETLASFTLQRDYGVRPGTVISLPTAAASQRQAVFNALNGGRLPKFAGPTMAVRVVGIVAAENEFSYGQGVAYDLYPGPGFAVATKGTPALTSYYVRLRHGQADFARFEARTSRVDGAGVQDLDRPAATITSSVHPQAVGWLVLAALAGLAAVAVVGPALARQARRARPGRAGDGGRGAGPGRAPRPAHGPDTQRGRLLPIPTDFGTGGIGTGAAMTTAGYTSLVCPASPGQAQCRMTIAQSAEMILVRAAPGPAGAAALAGHVARHQDNVNPLTVPAALVNFGASAAFPLLIGGVVAVCGLAALAHLLVVSVARRRTEGGLLMALGMVRRQLAAIVLWQATTVAVIAIAAGIPLGIAAGRAIWRAFAISLGVVPVPVVQAWLIVALAAGALLAANALAAVPAMTAARSRPGQLLRTE